MHVLVIIGDPELDDPEYRAALRARFTIIVKHVIGAWKIDRFYHSASPMGPERWLAEMGDSGVIVTPLRAFPKSQWEFCFVRNSRMVNELRRELESGNRVLALYFRGPLKGTKNTEDIANKLSEIGVRSILLPWVPGGSDGLSEERAVQTSHDEREISPI
jgi:hypothetical protein